MVALQGLADVLGVAVGHAVHVEVAEAGAQHHQDLRQDRSTPAQSSCGEEMLFVMKFYFYFYLFSFGINKIKAQQTPRIEFSSVQINVSFEVVT